MSYTMKSLRWVAPVALVGAIGLAACGDGDDAVSARTADLNAEVGSDQHLENQAADIARRSSDVIGSDRHLENQAADIAERSSTPTAVSPTNRAAYAAEAELYVELQMRRAAEANSANRSALAADAERYVELQLSRAAEAEQSGSDAGPNVFEAGNRAVAEQSR